MTKQIRIYLFLFLATLLAGLPAYGQVGSGIITMTTAKNVGEQIYLYIIAYDDFTIDGVEEQPLQGYKLYTITNQQIVIRGNVIALDCPRNSLTSLDVSGCTALTTLTCNDNRLTALDVSGCTALTTLTCYQNQLTALDLSGCIALTTLTCYQNQLTALDVSGCTALTSLDCRGNQLIFLFVSGCTALTSLDCGGNHLTKLDVSGCTALTKLTCYGNQLTALDVSGCTALTSLDCGDNQLTALDVSGCTALTKLSCIRNQLTALDVSGCTALTELSCWKNRLTALDVSDCTALTQLKCNYNLLASLNASGCTALTQLTCYGNRLTALDVSDCTALTELKCYNNQIRGPEMTLLVKSLVNRPRLSPGRFVVYCYSEPEGNLCYSHDVDLAREKNWFTFSINGSSESIYNGKPSTQFSVTKTIEGEGTLNVIGTADLNAVLEGTELTIKATPAEGYELTALTANGTNILATKKIVVKGATEIKATFAKKTFTVTLTKEGEGTLNATGADNLNAVEYGTELTIDATPAEGYTLVALTANGADILATKKVVVKEATEVKATFAKKTFTVTLTKEGEGTLNATGADNLNAVEYGNELTIEATPAEGYTLVALTANGADILATKKVVVKEATEVKATFAKKTFTVTLTKEGEGILRSTGAGNLKSVMYATELTIIATPADGYELKALTANGADILASKKVVVKENTEVKAIFTKKTFAVELTQEGEGLLDATGADDLSAVPLDTELTIVATPADGYELKALTANGTDILATKKFVVKGATKIKATFTKKTAANRVESSSVRLYDANGTLLYEARTDDHGMLQIELSAYAEGTYLLRVGGDAQRLLIQR